MSKTSGLTRQLALSTATIVLATTCLLLLTFWFYNSIVEFIAPGSTAEYLADPDDWVPSFADWIWIGIIILVGLLGAIWSAMRVAKRVLAPLTSLAESLTLVAEGNLDVRAASVPDAPNEASQLVESFNEMADRLQRLAMAQSTWNASIAHELRTPVTILRGRLQGLAEGVFEPSQDLFLNLLGQVEGLSRLIDDLRIVSLADSGYLDLRKEMIDLSPVVEDLVRLLEPDMQRAGIKVQTCLTTIPVLCDGVRMRQALMILLDNAKKHAMAQHISISTACTKDFYIIGVEDDGHGVPEEAIGQLFEAFTRGNRETPAVASGSGLGLAVTRAIALAHGGSVSCQRKRMRGARFEVRIPLRSN